MTIMAKKRPAPDHPEPAAQAAEYTVLARRYRPQQFADLVGQEDVAQALVNALKGNRVAHAYLFTGTRGVGKTSAARILAKALNCIKGPTPTPCDECSSCRAIAAGEDVDVQEIDGASNRNLEDIRELRQNVQYKPIQSRYKIYIIDEVHQLTKDSFNALLKTLEEPPPHVKFIFATTDYQKVPLTILSRCQRFDFAGISTRQIRERLRQVVAEEGAEADDEALEIIARRAANSMRDAQSLLDQCLAFGSGKLTAQAVHRILGTADEDLVAGLAAAVLGQDVKGAVERFNSAMENGVQLGELLDQMMSYWRDLLLMKTAGRDFDGFLFSQRFHDALQQQAQSISQDVILLALDLLAATASRLRSTAHGRVLVEVLLVRLSRLDHLSSVADLAQRVASSSAASLSQGQGTRTARAASPLPSAQRATQAPSSETKPNAIPWATDSLPQIWEEVLASVGGIQAAQLKMAVPTATFAPNCLVLRFPGRYNKEAESLQEPGRLEKITAALAKCTGQNVAVRFEVVAEQGIPILEPERRLSRAQEQRQNALQEPLVKQAMTLFDAQLVNADEGFGVPARPASAEDEE